MRGDELVAWVQLSPVSLQARKDFAAGKGGNAGTNGKASVAGGVGIVRWSRKLTTATIAMASNPSVVGSSPTWGTKNGKGAGNTEDANRGGRQKRRGRDFRREGEG
ncbi:hypothetical protein HD592_001985 [Schaalia hyovaginalis]|uniref:Uncharacterized protein n=1 Tax=Schaalia hyovaginalis TaxID=29316 RepID=A0A923IYQ0_9ACTO|nr:hypothetical protein [Schaalia hyovaginalis]